MKGDTILFRNDEGSPDHPYFYNDYQVSAEVVQVVSASPYKIEVKMLFLGDETGSTDTNNIPEKIKWFTLLSQEKPLFEFKFPRFAYRYIYQDGQYSCISPFSEPAFLPGEFNYAPKEGYNLGMVNTLRSLYVTDFVPDKDSIPKGVNAVDVLYKESNSTAIYTIKTIKDTDPEWSAKGSAVAISDGNLTPNGSKFEYSRTSGSIKIESEMVHGVIPSNQLLRPWDNVPRWAKAQEITGNRLVYANYVQNYNLK